MRGTRGQENDKTQGFKVQYMRLALDYRAEEESGSFNSVLEKLLKRMIWKHESTLNELQVSHWGRVKVDSCTEKRRIWIK